MNELKFNSQVCTTKIQSQRLLELGLKPETADMHYMAKTHWGDNWFISKNERYYCLGFGYHDELRHRYNGAVEVIPAWSLHRLIEILDSPLIEFNTLTHNPYEEIIDLISECLKLKLITNKEYLKQ